ncbi:MAG: diaminopimelate epimerase [Myxococcales bacterium]|nr:diaminopimelate epimerase [Myxococcales bacterium]
MARAFEKWEGLGNDFVIVEVAGEHEWLDHARVRSICDRRRGVGADGVLFVERAPAGSVTHGRMTVFNADGSRPEMCGNGLRCVAAYLARESTSSVLDIVTDDGVKRCSIERDTETADVEVEMGHASIDPEQSFQLAGATHRFLRVATGNPHAITFERYQRADIERIGPLVEQAIPGGANVEFAVVDVDGIDVVVWERGVGFTLACGTGACAVAAAACFTGRARFGEPIRVTLPGGPLAITVAQGSLAMRMRGPARRVFTGSW